MILLHILPIATAFVLTPTVHNPARRRNLVAQPREDQWHHAPTALCGGIAMFVVVLTVSLATGPDGEPKAEFQTLSRYS